MDTELIDRAAALVADLDRGIADDPAVDWGAGPPEGGLDHGYALGIWLLSATLDEPQLAPLAEALTRPQAPARPAAGKRAQFLDEQRWQNPYAIACGRLLTRGPWADRALEVSVALRALREPAITPTLIRLLLAGAEHEHAVSDLLVSQLEALDPDNPRVESLRARPKATTRTLVFADELHEAPELLDIYLERFAGTPGAELVVYAPGWTPEQTAARIGPIVAAAGQAASSVEVTALAVASTDENDSAVAGSVTVLISHREHSGPFGSLTRMR